MLTGSVPDASSALVRIRSPEEVSYMGILIGLVIFYFALMIFPWMLKFFGFGFIAIR